MSEKKTKEFETSTTAKEVADVVKDNYAKALISHKTTRAILRERQESDRLSSIAAEDLD